MLSHCTPEKHLRTTTPKLYAQSSHEPGTTSTYTYNTTIQSMTATIGANIAAHYLSILSGFETGLVK